MECKLGSFFAGFAQGFFEGFFEGFFGGRFVCGGGACEGGV